MLTLFLLGTIFKRKRRSMTETTIQSWTQVAHLAIATCQ